MNNKTNNLQHLKATSDTHYLGLPIMADEENEAYIGFIEKSFRELTFLCARYTRTLIVRVDLHPSSSISRIHPHDINIAKFRKSLVRKLGREYNSKVAYGWVRENGHKEYNEGWHWHWWIGLKISNTMRPYTQATRVNRLIIRTWEEIVGGTNDRNNMAGWFYLQRASFTLEKRKEEQNQIANGTRGNKDILFNRQPILSRAMNKNKVLGGAIDECFYAISYLAKVHSKVRTEGSKSKPVYKTSNLNTDDKTAERKENIERQLDTIRNQLSTHLDPIPISQDHINEYEFRKAQQVASNKRLEEELERQRQEDW